MFNSILCAQYYLFKIMVFYQLIAKFFCEIYIKVVSRPCGFARGLQPEKIIGITDDNGVLEFLIKWYVPFDFYPATNFNFLSSRTRKVAT